MVVPRVWCGSLFARTGILGCPLKLFCRKDPFACLCSTSIFSLQYSALAYNQRFEVCQFDRDRRCGRTFSAVLIKSHLRQVLNPVPQGWSLLFLFPSVFSVLSSGHNPTPYPGVGIFICPPFLDLRFPQCWKGENFFPFSQGFFTSCKVVPQRTLS